MIHRLYTSARFLVLTLCCSLDGFTIVLDPGHGGVYTGGVSRSGRIVEKDTALLIVQRLAKRLQKRGTKVILTRSDDSALDATDMIADLKKRAAFTEQHKADLFLSVHLNSNPNPAIQGYEVYVPYETRYPIKSYQLASALHYDISHTVEPDFTGGTLGNVNLVDRGIRASRFNVLMYATCPAVLVEIAFLTHAATARALENSKYIDQLVEALYQGICRYRTHLRR
jgi:N-acetylmuramoyl-L-alanine amidase